MAPRNARGAAEALAPVSTPTTSGADELAGLDMPTDADDGLGEASGEDLKIATKLLNMKGVGADGRKIPEDEFYDTIDQNTVRELDAVFLYLHKTNLYSVYDNAEGRTKTVCRSFDRVTGTMDDGTERPCKGCPDDQWYTEDGKRRKNCGPVYNVAALDRSTRMPFWFRFKRTSLPVFKQHLQRHHLGRRVVNGKRENYPLYAFQVTLRAKMSDDGKYALPLIERGNVLPQAEMVECADACATIKANVAPLLAAADAQAAGAEVADGGDTSFGYGANVAADPDAGKDFTA
jgi:hypothetical protein